MKKLTIILIYLGWCVATGSALSVAMGSWFPLLVAFNGGLGFVVGTRLLKT